MSGPAGLAECVMSEKRLHKLAPSTQLLSPRCLFRPGTCSFCRCPPSLQADWQEGEETRSRGSRGGRTAARTARTGEWDEGVFSDEEGGGDGGTIASGKTARTDGGLVGWLGAPASGQSIDCRCMHAVLCCQPSVPHVALREWKAYLLHLCRPAVGQDRWGLRAAAAAAAGPAARVARGRAHGPARCGRLAQGV